MLAINKVILDTNILHDGVSKAYSDGIADLLPKIESRGLGLALSSFSLFEVYRGLNKDKIPVTRRLVDTIAPLEADVATFRIAAALYSCYHHHPATKNTTKYDDDGDLVIAATAFRYNAALLSANGNDFPRPFFSELESYTITRRSDKAELVIQLLKPEIHVFNQALKACLH